MDVLESLTAKTREQPTCNNLASLLYFFTFFSRKLAKRNFLSASVQSEKATWQFLKTNASSLMYANWMSSGLKIKRWAFFVFSFFFFLLSNAIIIQAPP